MSAAAPILQISGSPGGFSRRDDHLIFILCLGWFKHWRMLLNRCACCFCTRAGRRHTTLRSLTMSVYQSERNQMQRVAMPQECQRHFSAELVPGLEV